MTRWYYVLDHFSDLLISLYRFCNSSGPFLTDLEMNFFTNLAAMNRKSELALLSM